MLLSCTEGITVGPTSPMFAAAGESLTVCNTMEEIYVPFIFIFKKN